MTVIKPSARTLCIGPLLVASVVASLGCKSEAEKQTDIANGDDPMAALTVTAATSRYGTAFWGVQSDSNTALWKQAKEYCDKNGVTAQGQKPNCGAVAAVKYEETSRHPDRAEPGSLKF
jgi:hypothetical protein